MVASFETSTVPTILPLIIKQVRFHDATSKQRKASDHNFSSSKLGRFYWVKFVFSLPKMTYHAWTPFGSLSSSSKIALKSFGHSGKIRNTFAGDIGCIKPST